MAVTPSTPSTPSAAAPSAIAQAIWGAGRSGPQLPAAQQQKVASAIRLAKAGPKVSQKEFQKGRKLYKKSGEDFGNYLSALTGTVPASQLSKKVSEKLEKKGYSPFEDYYTKKGKVTTETIKSLSGAGFAGEDVQAYLADRFASNALDEQARLFMGQSYGTGAGYKLDPITGKYTKVEVTIPIVPVDTDKDTGTDKDTDKGGGIDISKGGDTGTDKNGGTDNQGIFAGLNPDEFQGFNPEEIAYSFMMDPEKLRARTSERLARIQQGTALYNLIPSVF